MPELTVIYWRDIPAQVTATDGPAAVRVALPDRFQEAIDDAAMAAGLVDSDDYLAEWRKADPIPVSDDLEAEVEKAFQDLDTKYDRERLVALVKAGGKENV